MRRYKSPMSPVRTPLGDPLPEDIFRPVAVKTKRTPYVDPDPTGCAGAGAAVHTSSRRSPQVVFHGVICAPGATKRSHSGVSLVTCSKYRLFPVNVTEKVTSVGTDA